MANYKSEDIRKATEAYVAGQRALSDVEVEISRENTVDPLMLVRCVNSGRSVDNLVILAAEMLRGSSVRFKRGREVLYSAQMGIDLTAETFSNRFVGQPAFMELLLNTVYGIMLKKLTPPSSGLTAPALPTEEAREAEEMEEALPKDTA
jgi:hypothetical protein